VVPNDATSHHVIDGSGSKSTSISSGSSGGSSSAKVVSFVRVTSSTHLRCQIDTTSQQQRKQQHVIDGSSGTSLTAAAAPARH
jgi:hypothetical protein